MKGKRGTLGEGGDNSRGSGDGIGNRRMILVNIFLSALLFTMFLGAWLLGT